MKENWKQVIDGSLQEAEEATTGDNFKHINTIDTCPVMLSMWKHLYLKFSLQHLFLILYNLHGIQLLIRELITSFKKVHDDAKMIAKVFKNLQYV